MSVDVSVVIPTHRRETRLAFALAALAAQTLPAERFEVIVVRSFAESPLTEPPPGLDVRFLEAGVANISAQRNRGWRAARGGLVAFTDDDCRPEPEWLERLLAAGAADGALLQGRTEPDPDEAHLLYGIARSVQVEPGDGWYQTCNIAYRRELLERLGGFDERLAFHCEDSDLGLRARAAGAELARVDDAVVHHCVHVRGLADALADAARISGEPALLARFPAQRERLYLGAFVHPDHAKLLLALAGLPLWRRSRPLALAAAVPYVLAKARGRLSRRRPSPLAVVRVALDLAVEGTVDVVEVAMRARASAKYRQIVL